LKEFPKDIKFKYSWRKYQQRVLNELEEHLADDHLHIIAPPGSGKTVLGLEVALRLNQPTLILVPSIAIQNQWIIRFCDLFLQTKLVPEWISRDIRNPSFMSVVTYQGLHSACNNQKEIIYDDVDNEEFENEDESTKTTNVENIIILLKQKGVKTIIIDEAHHLKNAWWHTLSKVKTGLNPIIVGLTATPPYDVSFLEWKRYMELNGPVDSEISVPELVLETDLCPHQDYVHLSLPTSYEKSKINDFRKKINKIFDEVKNDNQIIKALENHPIWKDPLNNLEWIYNNIEYYSAVLIYLNYNKKKILNVHFEVIGEKGLEIPQLDYKWMELILEFILYFENEYFTEFDEYSKLLENKLRRSGVIERKKIKLSSDKKVSTFLNSSISKLNGIKSIVEFEYKQLGNELRLVVLTDFIRKEYYINSDENNLELNKIGIIPIFELLRRNNHNKIKIGVLTGSIIIIPKILLPMFEKKAQKIGVNQIKSNNVPFDNNYIEIHQSENIKNNIVNIITLLFQEGEIEVLIGTKSLLGEGWDAPAINSLILASFVGSFVLSNQMRGRAIRKLRENSNKTGNIWHLVCVDQTSANGGSDLELLKRRFKSFVGVSFNENSGIENGYSRLNLPEKIHNEDDIENINFNMFTQAKDREGLRKRWNKAISKGINLVEEIKIPFSKDKDYKPTKTLYFNKTLKNLFATLTSGLIAFSIESLNILTESLRFIDDINEFYFYLSLIGIVGFVSFGSLTFKNMKLYLSYRDISKDIHKISEVLLNSLVKEGIIKTQTSKLNINSSIDEQGTIYCHLEGASTFEKSTFINTLKEIILPIESPKYIIVRKNKFLKIINQKDYHAVPEIIGKNKASAEYFYSQWKNIVGSCELVYTRTIEGRKLLLQSRIKSLVSQLDDNIEQINVWK